MAVQNFTPSATKALSVLILELAVANLLASICLGTVHGSPTPWKFKLTAGASHSIRRTAICHDAMEVVGTGFCFKKVQKIALDVGR